ncbi:Gfo/Idh/MocA family protein [Kibdelosporangium phytohabitans]|uniref:Oxidoreductase n=1 Tax=Kibdelosporangium phytohabitans TaxID=860235 RepID=A0A0N9HYK2_9PSEU|nr:Gfo/Idh/MocA family oxidoreductase [Kibdelosporangium phytohabitans]ALG07368.1 oxidoreductase [Kibdelosporangium phytohabitans]MBE1471755.1 putative dehydrogenase [Kibdelosporangium phytohabitans]
MSLRVGLIGYGTAGAVFHAPLITTTPGLTLRSVVTSREVPDGVRRLDRPDQLWEDHDLVVIASPNRTHVPLATAAVEAGLPVVVDKPFAPTVTEARALTDLAATRGVPLTVFQNRRWDGDFLTVKDLVRSGALGDVNRFESHFDRWRPAPKQGWRELPGRDEAGGVLFDLGAHLIDQALHLFGPVRSVYSEVRKLRAGVQVDDDFFLALRHENGVVSHLASSTLAAQPGPRFRVTGSASAYTKHGLDVQEAALKAGQGPGSPGWGEEPEQAWGLLGAAGETTPVRTKPGAYQYFYAAMVSVLRDGAPVPVAPESAIAALEIIETALASG